MREVAVDTVTEAVRDLCIKTNTCLRDDQMAALRRGLEEEESELGHEVIEKVLENAEVSCSEGVPFCQDTGYAVFYLDVGQEVRFTGGEIGEAINEGVRRGYGEGFLRKSMVQSPIKRENTGDNTPAVIYYDIVPGEDLKLTMLVKGGGCDNMSRLTVLTPADGVEGMKDFVVETVEKAGPNASPPLTVGVGMGGLVGFELARELRRRFREPAALLVASQNAPRVVSRRNRLGASPLRHLLSKEDFNAMLRSGGRVSESVIENPRFMRVFEPMIRADYALVDTYEYEVEEPLRCPLFVLLGEEDANLSEEDVAGWCAETSGRFCIRRFSGGHFFFEENIEQVLGVVSGALRGPA